MLLLKHMKPCPIPQCPCKISLSICMAITESSSCIGGFKARKLQNSSPEGVGRGRGSSTSINAPVLHADQNMSGGLAHTDGLGQGRVN